MSASSALPPSWAHGEAHSLEYFRGHIIADDVAEGQMGDGEAVDVDLAGLDMVGDAPEVGALIEIWGWTDDAGYHVRGNVTRRRLTDIERAELVQWLRGQGVDA